MSDPNQESGLREQLAEKITELENRIDSVESENERLREENERLREEVKDLSFRLETLEERPTVEYTEHVDDETLPEEERPPRPQSLKIGPYVVGSKIYDETEQRLGEMDDRLWSVEERLEEASLGETTEPETTETREEPASKLLSIVSWSEPQAKEHLKPNQQRARNIAKDLGEYTTKTPKGYVLRSTDVRTILTTLDEERPHPETVRRTMNFLKRFAGEHEVQDTIKNGERRLYWTREARNRYQNAIPGTAHVVCDKSPEQPPAVA